MIVHGTLIVLAGVCELISKAFLEIAFLDPRYSNFSDIEKSKISY